MDNPSGKPYNKPERKELEGVSKGFMSECNHDCGSCSAECSSRKPDPSEFLEALNPESSVKKVIGIVSGKGGVGNLW